MLKIGIVGWRGMVGSVLMARMREERDFDHFEPVFFSTSQAGGAAPEQRQDGFIARRFLERGARARLLVIPRYTHMGHWALHNEKLAWIWLWALKQGWFGALL